MTPSSARPAPYFKPVKMKGTVPGRMMLEKIFTLEAQKLRATLEARFARLDARLGVDEDRDDGAEENDHDFGPDADAEPDDDEGQERYARHRVERVDEGADHVLQALGQTDSEPERDRQRQRRAVAQDEFG